MIKRKGRLCAVRLDSFSSFSPLSPSFVFASILPVQLCGSLAMDLNSYILAIVELAIVELPVQLGGSPANAPQFVSAGVK